MRTTLFHIPSELLGLPLFGIGLLLAVWIVVCASRIAWEVYHHGWSTAAISELPMMLLLGAVIGWVLPALADSEGLPIRGYGVMVFAGVAAGVALAVYRAKREGYDPEIIYTMALWLSVAAIAGARLFYIIEYWDEYRRPTLGATIGAIVNYTKGGLVVYGAFFGGVVAALVFFRRYKLPVLKFLDLIVPSMVLGLALGRVGCFLNGCCYGGICELPWAVSFPANSTALTTPPSPPYLNQLIRGKIVLHGIHFDTDASSAAIIRSIDDDSPARAVGLRPGDEIESIAIELPGVDRPLIYPADQFSKLNVAGALEALSKITSAGTRVDFHLRDPSGQPITRTWTLAEPAPIPPRSLPVHPSQLYSAIGAFLLTLFLLAWYPLRRHDGEVTALLITIYPIMRIFEEAIRHDEPLIGRTGMTISQNVSLLLLAVAVTLWIYILRGPRLKYGLSTGATAKGVARQSPS